MICREGTVGASERAQCREVADWCRVQTRDKEQTRDRSQSVTPAGDLPDAVAEAQCAVDAKRRASGCNGFSSLCHMRVCLVRGGDWRGGAEIFCVLLFRPLRVARPPKSTRLIARNWKKSPTRSLGSNLWFHPCAADHQLFRVQSSKE